MVITLGTVGCRRKDDKKEGVTTKVRKKKTAWKNKTFSDSCNVCDGMKFTPMAQERPMSLKIKK